MENKEMQEIMEFTRALMKDSFVRIIKNRTPEDAAEYFMDHIQNLLKKQMEISKQGPIRMKKFNP